MRLLSFLRKSFKIENNTLMNVSYNAGNANTNNSGLMGIKCVPVFGKATISSDRLHFTAPDGFDLDYFIGAGTIGDAVQRCAEEYFEGADPVGKTHTREGVVVRIINRPKFCGFKAKNFEFKVLEGLIKDTASAPDMEEAQDVTE